MSKQRSQRKSTSRHKKSTSTQTNTTYEQEGPRHINSEFEESENSAKNTNGPSGPIRDVE